MAEEISSNSRRYDLAGVCIECCLGLVLVLGLGLHVGSGPGLIKVGFRVRVSHRFTCSYNRCSHHNPDVATAGVESTVTSVLLGC